jgi:hypothetical protein
VDLHFLLEDLVSLAVFSGIPYVLKRLLRGPSAPVSPQPSAKTLRRQFWFFLILFALSLYVFASAEGPRLVHAVLRIACAIVVGFSFLFVWGAFDIAFSFYPPDEPHPGVPDDPCKERLVDPSPVAVQPSVKENTLAQKR